MKLKQKAGTKNRNTPDCWPGGDPVNQEE
jgi:hypothetical protein